MDEEDFRGYFDGIDDHTLDIIAENDSIRELLDIGYFNQDIGHDERIDARDIMSSIFDEYGYDFDVVFDWDAWWEALYGG